MKTKSIATIIVVAVLGVCAFFVGRSTGHKPAAGATSSASQTLYTCGMHPQVVRDHPGNCPICGMKLTAIRKQIAGPTSGATAKSGERKIKYYKSTMIPGEVKPEPGKDSMGMDLVPVYEDEGTTAESKIIAVSPVTVQNMGIRTAKVTRGPLHRVIRTLGTIDYNETALADVTTKVKGWIEKLHVAATGQPVHRGDPLFEIYSPELYSAQAEYVLALGQATNDMPSSFALLESARTKLKFFDISDEQVAELEKTRQPKKTLAICAPIDGFVVEKTIVEGQMVDAGMKLYRIANLDTVWVQAQIYEQDLPFVKPNQPAVVKLLYLPERQFHGYVSFIYPTLDEKTRTARVRLELANPGHVLKPGMYAAVELRAEMESSALLVPDTAVLRSGERNTVFVALDGGRFEPRSVTLGPRGEGGVYQVLSGVTEGERVVISGQFMLDSESQLQEAILKMSQPVATTPQAGTRNIESQTHLTKPANAADASPVLFTCPMESDVEVVTDSPGQCHKCGMNLVPTGSVPHGRVAEENWRRRHAASHQH